MAKKDNSILSGNRKWGFNCHFNSFCVVLKKIFLLFLLLRCVNSKAQQVICGFDLLRQIQINSDNSFKYKEDKLNRLLYNLAVNHPGFKNSQTILEVPVVVHIIHQNGLENIPDSVVIAAINQLNLRFQNALPYYDSTGNAVNIQFCLASIDPQGNPTIGITRDTSALTDLWVSNDLQMKNLNRWDPNYYYNIWSVRSIFGFNMSVAGYATLPANAGDSTDGVVILSNAINSEVLCHESGHYLGLYHTFTYMDCSNYNCLLDGDMVCDTPPDTSTDICMGNSCSTDMDDTTGFSPLITDVDEVPNYMDYTPCPLSFTQGQADRMSDALTTARSTLLQSVGCGFTGGNAPVAQISYLISPCNDGVVYFNDSLSSSVTTANWDFDNDGVYDSFQHDLAFIFSATGSYTVKLLVTGLGGVDSAFQSIFVQKAPSLYYPITTYSGIFTNPNGGWNSCGNFSVNFSADSAQSYIWSTGDTSQSITFTPDSTFTLTLTIVDFSGLTWTNQVCHPLIVNVYPLPPEPVIYSNDSLTICDGDTVTISSLVNGTGNYVYNWYQNGSVQPSNDSVFFAVGYFPGIPYQLVLADTNGCYNYSNLLYVYSYAPPPMQSLTQNNLQLISGWGSGNQWYLNGIPIPGATGTTYDVTQPGCYSVAWFLGIAPQCSTMSDTICFISVGINEIIADDGILIHPLLFSDDFEIHSSASGNGVMFYIHDITGRTLISGKLQTAITKVHAEKLASGIYFLDVIINKQHTLRKLLKE